MGIIANSRIQGLRMLSTVHLLVCFIPSLLRAYAPQIVEGANRGAGMSKLAGKRVLVTGGAGFIGSHIVDLLANEGCRRIVAIDNFVRGDPKNLARC